MPNQPPLPPDLPSSAGQWAKADEPGLPSIDVVVAPRAAGTSSRSTKRASRLAILVGVIGAMTLLVGCLAWLALRPASRPAYKPALVAAEAPSGDVPRDANLGLQDETAATTSPGLQWQSPTNGAPLHLDDAPPGAQMLCALRPKAWLAQAEGRKTLEGLAPLVARAAQEASEILPRPWEELDRLLVSWWEDRDGAVQFALVADASEPFQASDLESLAPQLTAESPGRWQRDGRGWWLPPRHADRRLVVAPIEELRQIVDQNGAAPELRRDLAELAQQTDNDRQAVLLVSRDFWAVAGADLVNGPWAILEPLLRDLLADDWQAAQWSTHLGDNWFGELRLAARPDSPAARRIGRLQRDLAALPTKAAQRVADASADTYGRPLLARWPLMVEAWQGRTRVSVEGRHVLARSYLPAVAAHNAAWVASLLLTNDGDAETLLSAPPAAAASLPTSAISIAQRLQEKTSLTFPRATLEGALETLASQLGVPIEIRGRDLQLEGITKNQSFGLDVRDQSAADILRQILRQASPDGKLVYVVGAAADGVPTLYITTRAAATERGEEIEP